jgi:hypothetical protein
MDLYIPTFLLNIILDYDGRIKYKNGKYINIIHKHDLRYNMLEKIINKKKVIMHHTDIDCLRFYFEIPFESHGPMGLCYDYGWSFDNIFEICFYNFKSNQIQQIRIKINI